MSLRDKVAQLVFASFYGEAPNTRSQEYQKYLRWVRNLRLGGLVLVNRVRNGAVEHAEPFAMATFLNRMQKAAKVPLLVAGDFERGDSMRVVSQTLFPHAMAFAATRDPALSRYEGAVTARQARALGVPWILAPVADVNINPDNPILNIRSYGENPAEVSAHVRAFIEGAHSVTPGPVLVTAKHFPGHGDTATDTHLALAVLTADKARLEALELVPFRAAIAAGADAVMTAHIAVPALDDPGTPATLSRAILTGLLREGLGFQGLIVTDALDMNGIAKHWSAGQAAVKALDAGADVLLMPANPEQAVDAVVRAVQTGALRRQRIDESVSRLLAVKVRLGLNRRRFVDPEAAMDELDSPEDIARVQEIADRAVTLVKNEGSLVPLKSGSACFLLLPEGRNSEQGKAFAAEVRKRSPNAPDRDARAGGEPGGFRPGRRHGQQLRRGGGGGIRFRSGLPRQHGARRRLPGAPQRPPGRRAPGDSGGARQSVPDAGFPRRGRLSHDLQHRAAVGDRGGEGAVRRDSHPGPPAGDHSRHRQVRRRHPAPPC